MSGLVDAPATGRPADWIHRTAVLLGEFGGAGAVIERNARTARRGLVVLLSGFFEPLFYLLSLGVGIGALVGEVHYGGKSFGYQEFIAPALLAASAMNGAIADSTFNVFWKLRYARVYDGMLATPLGPRAVAAGEISWALLRGAGYATAFLLILLVAGFVRSWWAVLAVPAATLVGLAFAGAGMAATTFMRSWQDFDLVNLVVLPLTLLSTTFYPLSTYPHALGLLVQLTPLYHGVELERALVLGTLDLSVAVHVLYLLLLGVGGLLLAGRRLERLLLS
ncbi:ABC transporter permease [Kineosporia sp. J2-2]|uniref:Transport permease protein n=1 Tax=Kineosporia corallincola TaxID=2835133 RepID=A0ABS5TSS8_9ACTN|nr:ABC transporter permease [Kineosporia corallincola]MBT0773877.1 ABC transporter permease [Kineosporia corallincola]